MSSPPNELARALAALARELDHTRWSAALSASQRALELAQRDGAPALEARDLLELLTATASLASWLEETARKGPPVVRLSLSSSSDGSRVGVTLRIPSWVEASPDVGPGIDLAIVRER